MKMALVRDGNRLVVELPAYDSQERIRQRHAQDQDWDQEGDGHGRLESENRQRRQAEAQEQRPGVTHEDAGGMEVEEQKAYDTAQQNGAQKSYGPVAGNQGQHHDRKRADGRYACSQTVQAVNQIDRVGNPHDPEDRDQNAHPRIDVNGVAERQLNVVDIQAVGGYGGSRRNLPEELQLRRNVVPVVIGAYKHDNASADQHAQHHGKIILPDG